MVQITRCPHCNTLFKVSDEQLHQCVGIVRCSACNRVFNGIEQLLKTTHSDNNTNDVPEQNVFAPQEPALTPSEKEPATEASVLKKKDEVTDAETHKAVIPQETKPFDEKPEPIATESKDDKASDTIIEKTSAGTPPGIKPKEQPIAADKKADSPTSRIKPSLPKPSPAIPDSSLVSPNKTTTVDSALDEEIHALSLTLDLTNVPVPVELEISAPVETAPAEPEISVLAETASVEPEISVPAKTASAIPEPPPVPEKPANDNPVGTVVFSLVEKPLEDNADILPSESFQNATSQVSAFHGSHFATQDRTSSARAVLLSSPTHASPEPDFVKMANKKQFAAGRTFLSLACFVLLLGLTVQCIYTFSNRIIAFWPPVERVIQPICKTLSCSGQQQAKISAITIESSDLRILQAATGSFSLDLLIKNNSTSTQLWPYLELTLMDEQKKPLVRRTFAPENYLSEAKSIKAGFFAGSEQEIKLQFSFQQKNAVDYRVYLFYP